ncbi:unnamed protein product [Cuscuta campestris]|nr:unnamed protein product [Cuscuta campestris]
MEKKSLYSSSSEFQCLITQVLSWDIRSLSQRRKSHITTGIPDDGTTDEDILDLEKCTDETMSREKSENGKRSCTDCVYHLILEGIDISYRIDLSGNVVVEKASLLPRSKCGH